MKKPSILVAPAIFLLLLIGLFTNLLPLRIGVGGDPTFVELLERARQTALGAFTHQDLPFDQVVDAVSPVRSTVRAPALAEPSQRSQSRIARTWMACASSRSTRSLTGRDSCWAATAARQAAMAGSSSPSSIRGGASAASSSSIHGTSSMNDCTPSAASSLAKSSAELATLAYKIERL